MEVFEAIYKRRSIRKYLDKDVPNDIILKIIDAGRWAPSSKNRQPWEFIIVKDKEKIRRTAKVKGQNWIQGAPILIFIVVDPKLSPTMYMVDGALASQNMALAAVELGLGTCWINIYEKKELKEMLRIPNEKVLLGALALGYPAENPSSRERKQVQDITYWEFYGNKLTE